jgi:hypothetical protein
MCCGNKNVQFFPQKTAERSKAIFTPASPRPMTPGRHLEYTGRTALTVVSPLTGRRYRFAEQGARVEVDGRDLFWMASYPNLQRV